MRITFLGTSSGMPTLRRNVTAAVIAPENSKRWYLVDCGEATQHQLLRTRFSMQHLQAIFITHVHGDHCYGLPGLLASAGTMGRSEALTIVAPSSISLFIAAICQHTLLDLPYAVDFHPVEELTGLSTKDYQVGRIALSHRVPSFAYQFSDLVSSTRLDTRKLRSAGVLPGPLWGALQAGENVDLPGGGRLQASEYLLPVKPQRIIVGGDNDQPELLAEYAPELDLLIHEATYTASVAQQVEPGPQHSSARSVASFAQRLGIPNLILTHFSKRYHHSAEASIAEVQQEAEAYYQGRLYLANDFDEYQLLADGELQRLEPQSVT